MKMPSSFSWLAIRIRPQRRSALVISHTSEAIAVGVFFTGAPDDFLTRLLQNGHVHFALAPLALEKEDFPGFGVGIDDGQPLQASLRTRPENRAASRAARTRSEAVALRTSRLSAMVFLSELSGAVGGNSQGIVATDGARMAARSLATQVSVVQKDRQMSRVVLSMLDRHGWFRAR
jgi:hypothetical protein